MANIVGGLAVLLGLDATEYTRGLTKAEYQAKQFARNTRSAILEVAKVIGTIEIGRQVYEATKAIIAEAAALNDLAAATDSSVESLSRLNNQVKISGGDIKSMNDAVLKLAAGMSGADSKGSKVNETLKLLGITAKDPVEALQQVALKLATYADGVNKVGLAQALFGKSGREFLKTLQDVAQLQEVSATVTKKQAQEAEALEQSWRRLSVESTKFQNAILSNVVPVLLEVVTNFNLARQAGEGFFGAMLRAGTNMATLPDQIARAGAEVEKLTKAVAAGPKGQGNIPGFLTITDSDLQEAKAKYKALIAIRNSAILQVQGDNSDQISRRFQRLAQAPAPPAGGAGGGRTRALKEQTTEAQRYLETLEKQNERTLELTHTEQFLRDVQQDRIKGLTPALTDQILKQVQLLDLAEAAKKAEQERSKLAADEARIREQVSNTKTRGIQQLNAETEALAQGNEQMRQEIEAIGLDATSLAQLTLKRLEDAAAMKEQEAAMYRNTVGMEAEAAALENQARILRERKGLVMQKGVADQMAADLEKAKEINDVFVSSFVDGAKSIIRDSKSIGDAIKSMGDRITDVLLDMALTNIAKSLFGAPTSSGGGGIFGGIGAAIMSGIFGGRAGGGPVAANQPYVVGERGPELFMPKTAGTIIPNSQTGRGNFVFNINVPAGATRSTIEQTQLKFGMALQSVMDRNG